MTDLLETLARADFYIRWHVSQVGPGRRLSRFRGAGLEFEKITGYELGDDPRWINWTATARTGAMRILKNSLVEERQLQAFVAVDLSGSMEFGTTRTSKQALAAEAAAVLAHVAWRMGDAVGFAGYAGRVERAWPPRRAARDRLLIPALILGARARGRADLSAVLPRLPRRRSLVFVLSDFQDDPAVLAPALTAAARHHDVVAVRIEDPRERSLPEGAGLIRMRDLETGVERSLWLDRAGREAWGERLRRWDEELTARLRRSGIEAFRLDPTLDAPTEIARFFLRRRGMARCASA